MGEKLCELKVRLQCSQRYRGMDVGTVLAPEGLAQQEVTLVATDKGGQQHRFTGEVLNVQPLLARGHEAMTILEGLTRWQHEGRTGYGICEYAHHLDAQGKPLRMSGTHTDVIPGLWCTESELIRAEQLIGPGNEFFLTAPAKRVSRAATTLESRGVRATYDLHDKVGDNRAARKKLATVKLSDKMMEQAAALCIHLKTDGLRGQLTLTRSARALAALEGKRDVTLDHLKAMAPLALRHRLDFVDGREPWSVLGKENDQEQGKDC